MNQGRLLLVVLCWSICSATTAQTISGVINNCYRITHLVPIYNGVRLADIAGLSPGDQVLIIQMQGATINETNSVGFGDVTAIGSAGRYEFATICGFLNDTIVFERTLLNTYNPAGALQLVRIPVYNDVTVTGLLQAPDWNPVTGTGGVLALIVNGTLTLQAGVSADGAGFKGGAHFVNAQGNCGQVTGYFYSVAASSGSNRGGAPKGEGIAALITGKEHGRGKQANGGGGGNVDNTGGGGGGNFGAGGEGGDKTNAGLCNASASGVGGLALGTLGYSSANNRIFLGGGGGCGEMNNIYSGSFGSGTPGGNGGGIIYIKCNELQGNGYTISANGVQGLNPALPVPNEAAGDGGGGGGAGGGVLLDVGTYNGNLLVQANGARGSLAGFQNQCTGPGGGGGGGAVWHNGTSLPGLVTAQAAGGASGIIKDAPSHNPPCELQPNGAAAGTAGLVQGGFTVPLGTMFNCGALLPASRILKWKGQVAQQQIQLYWTVSDGAPLRELHLQQQLPGEPFQALRSFMLPAAGDYQLKLPQQATDMRFRLQLVDARGSVGYSAVLAFRSQAGGAVKVFPNPANGQISMLLPTIHQSGWMLLLTDAAGRVLWQRQWQASLQQQQVTVPLQLQPGLYWLRYGQQGQWQVLPVVVQ